MTGGQIQSTLYGACPLKPSQTANSWLLAVAGADVAEIAAVVMAAIVQGTETTAVTGVQTADERPTCTLREHVSNLAGRLRHMTI